MDSTEVALISVEAGGEIGLPKVEAARSQAPTGMEYRQIGTRPVATEKNPGALLCTDKQLL